MDRCIRIERSFRGSQGSKEPRSRSRSTTAVRGQRRPQVDPSRVCYVKTQAARMSSLRLGRMPLYHLLRFHSKLLGLPVLGSNRIHSSVYKAMPGTQTVCWYGKASKEATSTRSKASGSEECSRTVQIVSGSTPSRLLFLRGQQPPNTNATTEPPSPHHHHCGLPLIALGPLSVLCLLVVGVIIEPCCCCH